MRNFIKTIARGLMQLKVEMNGRQQPMLIFISRRRSEPVAGYTFWFLSQDRSIVPLGRGYFPHDPRSLAGKCVVKRWHFIFG